ncbi:hypothetical protein V1505DRAFT_393334 [Lipomyces doorenjongii]
MMSNKRRQIGYAYSPEYTKLADLLPSNIGRASLVDDLIRSHDLIAQCDDIISPCFASKDQLTAYHDSKFISYLLNEEDVTYSDSEDESDGSAHSSLPNEDVDRRLQERFGLEFDCPGFDGLDKYIQAISGTTIACARYLTGRNANNDKQQVAINWHGGRHHARKDKCSGFCYVNDIVLGILELRKRFETVMYIDLDLHHGDGVETAFAYSNKVLTLSVHRYDRGFFPGSGNSKFCGKGRGQNYTINVGLRAGLNDTSLRRILRDVIRPAFERFQPEAVVLQCGADGLARDPTKEWNLSIRGLSSVILDIIDFGKPTLVVGGGGYNHLDAARLWCLVLGELLVGKEVTEKWDMIPEGSNFIHKYVDDGYAYFPDEVRTIDDLNLKDDFLDRVVECTNVQIAKIDPVLAYYRESIFLKQNILMPKLFIP